MRINNAKFFKRCLEEVKNGDRESCPFTDRGTMMKYLQKKIKQLEEDRYPVPSQEKEPVA